MEILTGEGKSCVIAMVAATYALLGRTVDIVTSSPVLSRRDAEEWREFYSSMKLEVGCNVDDNTNEYTMCYECPIVYGTVESFARDILITEFLLQDVRKCRKFDIVIVDEVDSMMIDQGVQCTYLSEDDLASIGMRHFEPILSFDLDARASRFTTSQFRTWKESFFILSEPEVFFMMHCLRLNNNIDPLQIATFWPKDKVCGIEKGFTDKYPQKRPSGNFQVASS